MGREVFITGKQVSLSLRPEENPDLIGHEAAEHFLWHAWRDDRLAHAWLIDGLGGIGKATLACRFARFVLATDVVDAGQKAGTLYVSPDHPTFHRVAARGHADFRIIEHGCNESGRRRSQILIEDIRDVGRFLTLTAADGGWRTVVIDSAETMNDSAGNALLKILEEPPLRSLLLLVSHNSGQLLATVRSRCRLLRLRPLRESHMSILLERFRPLLAPAQALAVIRLADGSIGRALALLDNNGVALYQTMLDLLASVPHLEGSTLHAFGDRLAQMESTLFVACGDLFKIWLLRLVRRGVTGQPMAEVIPGEESLALRLIKLVRLDQWVEVWESIGHLFNQAELLNLDRKQVILSAFLTINKVARF